jgi:hypothetical protein
MNPDRTIEELIRSSIDPSELIGPDPEMLKAKASRRRTRQRIVVVSAAALTIAVLVPVTLANRSTEPDQTSAPPIGRPACRGAWATAAGGGGGNLAVLAEALIGRAAQAAAVINTASETGVRVLTAEVIVAKPSTTSAAGNGQDLPATAVTRPENQLAVGRATGKPANGQGIAVEFTPAAAGDYPVFFVATYVASTDCTQPVPATGGPTTTTEQQLGIIRVK